jgi:hypothetical protein
VSEYDLEKNEFFRQQAAEGRLKRKHNRAIIRYEGRDARDRHRAECGWSDRAGVASGSDDCSIAERRQGSLAAMLNATNGDGRRGIDRLLALDPMTGLTILRQLYARVAVLALQVARD